MKRKSLKRIISAALVFTVLVASVQNTKAVYGAGNNEISYEFNGNDVEKPGYAQGTVTFTAQSAGTYYLYWADDTKALDGYYEITSMKLKAGESKNFTFGYHTAIPAGATKIIAVTDQKKLEVANAVAVYEIPGSKQLTNAAGNLLYTFNSYSDVHIDTEVYYTNSEKNWKNALKYAADMDTDFIVSSGDAVTNAKGYAEEWDVYERILAESDYTNPIWETNGNHDMRDEAGKDGQGVTEGVKTYDYQGNIAFNKATGKDSTFENLKSNKPYYYVVEEDTGDVFIFMALENGHAPASYDNFSKEQIEWLRDLLATYYGTGVNIYIIQHATFRGYGAGDIWTLKDNGYVSSYYQGHMYANGMKNSKGSTISGMDMNTAFKEILETYKDVIWMSGHTHQDFTLGNNYSNENGSSCNMIHNPAVVGTTYINENGDYEYDSSPSTNDGVGLNSQGYYVETYEKYVVYYGANLTEEKIYPAYCYIMEGSRGSEPLSLTETRKPVLPVSETLIPQKEVISVDATLEEAIEVTENMLEKYYSYSSYDQYQKLKKYYYNYNNNPLITDRAKAVSELKYASGQLYAIIHGNVEGDETLNSSTHYALRYYSDGVHGWDAVDTYFSKKGNGLYVYTYEAQNTNSISVNVYDTITATYHCVAESTGVTFADNLCEDYSLATSGNTRGKSITISGLEVGDKVSFLYNSNINELTIMDVTASDNENKQTPTPIKEPTATPTVTISPTKEATATPTATISPTKEATATPTATTSPTREATATPAATISPTKEATATPTVTVKPTKEATATPAATISPTKEATATISPTKEATATPTVTVCPTEKATATPTATVNPTREATSTPIATVAAAVTTAPAVSGISITPTAIKVPVIEKGTVYEDKETKAVYKVTKATSKESGTVQYVKPTSKNVTKVTIPAIIKISGKTYKVTSIAKNAFKNHEKLKKVTMGGNIKTIGANTFYGCKKLKTVSLGKNVTTIGNKAFYKCTALTKITIPSKVRKIGKQAFYGCKKLKSITIKTKKLNAKNIGSKAFYGIHKKATMKVPKSKVKDYKSMLKKKGIGVQSNGVG